MMRDKANKIKFYSILMDFT